MSAALDTKFDAAVEALGPPSVAVQGGADDLFMEIADARTPEVWMHCMPTTKERFQQLAPEQHFVKTGFGSPAMDRAAFVHAPDHPGTPLAKLECDGLTFHQVATPQEMIPPDRPGGPMRVTVHKHHLIGFDAGRDRDIVLMEIGGEWFAEVTGTPDSDENLVLPEGASLHTITLAEPFVVMLPEPTMTYFWIGENIRSFQGPFDRQNIPSRELS